MEVTLDHKLGNVLNAINELAKLTTMISINAGITASKISSIEGRAFGVIVDEIRRLNLSSMNELQNLESVLADIRNLYYIINIAGRQRMLSQKIMKLKLLMNLGKGSLDQFRDEYYKSIRLFEESLEYLFQCQINTAEIRTQLDAGQRIWDQFKICLESNDEHKAISLNEQLLKQMNEVTMSYEKLSG